MAELSRALHPYAWGLRSASFDPAALSNGMLRATELSAVFPDGDLYSAPYTDELPAPLAIDTLAGNASEIVFHLALHPMKEIGGNADTADSQTFAARYGNSAARAPDLFTQAAAADIVYLRKKVKLLADTEPRDQLLTIPVARVRRTANNGFELDESFIAPSLSVQAAPALHQQLRRLLDILQAKVNALYGFHREPSKNIIEFRSGDIASFWLLHTVNSAFAALNHLSQHPQLHPERLFQEMLRLAGALMTFSKTHTLPDLPVYRHDEPEVAFEKVGVILRDLLETVISTRYFAISLQEDRPSFHVGRLDSGKIDDKSSFYLAVSASLPTSEITEIVPPRFKVGAPDDVEKLVLSAMPGVPLTYVQQVPPAIPVKPGASYFALQARGSLYERMLKSQSIAIYTPAGIADLELELIAITS